MEKAITMIRIIILLLRTITQLKHMLMAGLNRLGLYKAAAPAQEADASLGENNSTSNNNNYILMLDGSSPSLVPVPVLLITATIKKTLPVVLLGEEEEEEVWCAVCWEWIKRREEIRVLCNCSHVFHRECLDRWVDEDQVSCPLCRSMLLPSTTNPWMVLRNNASHFSPEQQQQDHIHQLETTAAAAAAASISLS